METFFFDSLCWDFLLRNLLKHLWILTTAHILICTLAIKHIPSDINFLNQLQVPSTDGDLDPRWRKYLRVEQLVVGLSDLQHIDMGQLVGLSDLKHIDMGQLERQLNSFILKFSPFLIQSSVLYKL